MSSCGPSILHFPILSKGLISLSVLIFRQIRTVGQQEISKVSVGRQIARKQGTKPDSGEYPIRSKSTGPRGE